MELGMTTRQEGSMSNKLITTLRTDHVGCPETGVEEATRSLVDAAGKVLLVVRCTRFDPPEAMDCDTACVAAIDDDVCHRRR
jgi:hypothetical protein